MALPAPLPSRLIRARVVLAVAVVVHLACLLNLGVAIRGTQRGTGPFGLDRLFNDPMHTLGPGADFFQFYQSGFDVRLGWSIYQARTPDDPRGLVVPYQYGNHYPPFVAYAIGLPLTLLTPWGAYAAWVGLMTVLTWGAAVWSYRLADAPDVGCVAAALWLGFSPWYVDVYLGQINILMAVGLFALVRAFERDRPWRGSVVFMLLTVIKLFPLLFVPIFLKFRRWRPLLVCGVGLVVTFVPYFVWRPEDWRFFADWATAPDISPLAVTSGNHGLKVLLYHLTGTQVGPRMVGYLFLGIGIMVTFLSRSRDLRLYIGLWVCTFFFVQTFVWEHHYLLLVPVIVLLYLRQPSPGLLVAWVWLALPTLFVFLDLPEIGRRTNPTPYWAHWQLIAYHTWKIVGVCGLYGGIVGTLLSTGIIDPDPLTNGDTVPEGAAS